MSNVKSTRRALKAIADPEAHEKHLQARREAYAKKMEAMSEEERAEHNKKHRERTKKYYDAHKNDDKGKRDAQSQLDWRKRKTAEKNILAVKNKINNLDRLITRMLKLREDRARLYNEYARRLEKEQMLLAYDWDRYELTRAIGG